MRESRLVRGDPRPCKRIDLLRNGSYLHRLNADELHVEEERALVDCSHNGLLALSDGSLFTKDLRLDGQGDTTLSRFDPETLEPVGQALTLPEGSMGRIAADIDVDGVERVYVPGTEHVFRVVIDGDRMALDGWRPRYRSVGGPHGLAWDACLSGEAVWLMDNGDVPSVRHIHTTTPNGRFDTPPDLSWRQPAPWDGPQRLHRLDPLTGETTSVAPFGVPGGGIIAPPVVVPERGIAVAWDSINGGLAGVSIGDMETNWTLDIRPSMQPIVFPDSGELVINDFAEDGIDYLVVVDVETGELLDRATPARGLRTVCSSAPATIVTSTTAAPSRSPVFTGPDQVAPSTGRAWASRSSYSGSASSYSSTRRGVSSSGG